MEQRAVKDGVIGRRFIPSGEVFDHPEPMNWAEPVVRVPEETAPKRKQKAGKDETDPPGTE